MVLEMFFIPKTEEFQFIITSKQNSGLEYPFSFFPPAKFTFFYSIILTFDKQTNIFFVEKHFISLLTLGKNMSIAMQNMTESKKKIS